MDGAERSEVQCLGASVLRCAGGSVGRWPETPKHRTSDFSASSPITCHPLTLGAGEVHVICTGLELPADRLADLARTLSPDELDQAARFHWQRERDRFIARRGLLREFLGGLVQVEPRRLVFSTGPFGKPALAMPSLAHPVHFSAAHSGAVAAVALCHESPLGIDIEAVRDLPDLPALVETVLSEGERAKWRSLPKPRRLAAFFDVWTRKEAFLKGTGQGLQKPPAEIDVPLDDCGPDEALPICDLGLQVPEWSLRSLSTGDLAMALAVSRQPTRVCCWQSVVSS